MVSKALTDMILLGISKGHLGLICCPLKSSVKLNMDHNIGSAPEMRVTRSFTF